MRLARVFLTSGPLWFIKTWYGTDNGCVSAPSIGFCRWDGSQLDGIEDESIYGINQRLSRGKEINLYRWPGSNYIYAGKASLKLKGKLS
jgi:hypothetical protein